MLFRTWGGGQGGHCTQRTRPRGVGADCKTASTSQPDLSRLKLLTPARARRLGAEKTSPERIWVLDFKQGGREIGISHLPRTLQRSLHNRRSSRRASLCTCQMLNLRDYHFYLFPNAMRRRTPLKERTDTNSNQSKIKIKYLVHKYYHVYFTKLSLLNIAHNMT